LGDPDVRHVAIVLEVPSPLELLERHPEHDLPDAGVVQLGDLRHPHRRPHLERMVQLRPLRLAFVRGITGPGVERLQRTLPQCEIERDR
jgi:hypothetical protein